MVLLVFYLKRKYWIDVSLRPWRVTEGSSSRLHPIEPPGRETRQTATGVKIAFFGSNRKDDEHVAYCKWNERPLRPDQL
jgi:hypothetical protein